ncbi:hypothetical protein Tco_1128164 [Tanacetum coccineum]
MDFPSNLSLSLLASSAAHRPHNKVVAKIFQGVCLIALWCIWYWRNCLVHEVAEKRASILSEDCFSKIQSLSLLWISSRAHCELWFAPSLEELRFLSFVSSVPF